MQRPSRNPEVALDKLLDLQKEARREIERKLREVEAAADEVVRVYRELKKRDEQR